MDGYLKIDDDRDGDSFITIATGGMLALDGNYVESLSTFLDQIRDRDDIRYFNKSTWDWDHISNATRGEDYVLDYLTDGDLAGFTVLTVNTIPEPATMSTLVIGALAILRRRRNSAP